MTERYFEIVDRSTGEVVRRFDMTGKHPGHIDRFVGGLYRKVDFDRFVVRDSADTDPTPRPPMRDPDSDDAVGDTDDVRPVTVAGGG